LLTLLWFLLFGISLSFVTHIAPFTFIDNAMPLGNRRLIKIEQSHQKGDQSKLILD